MGEGGGGGGGQRGCRMRKLVVEWMRKYLFDQKCKRVTVNVEISLVFEAYGFRIHRSVTPLRITKRIPGLSESRRKATDLSFK